MEFKVCRFAQKIEWPPEVLDKSLDPAVVEQVRQELLSTFMASIERELIAASTKASSGPYSWRSLSGASVSSRSLVRSSQLCSAWVARKSSNE